MKVSVILTHDELVVAIAKALNDRGLPGNADFALVQVEGPYKNGKQMLRVEVHSSFETDHLRDGPYR